MKQALIPPPPWRRQWKSGIRKAFFKTLGLPVYTWTRFRDYSREYFYGITHNIFLAYGIADCLGVLLYIYIFRDIFKMLQLPKLVRMIVYVLLLTPYSLEPLGYMPMMFTGAAYYIIKVLIPIMLIDILLKIRLGIPVRRYLHILITYFAAVYLTALSCGLYLLICGLFQSFYMNCLPSSAVAVSKIFEQKHASARCKPCHLRTGLCQCKNLRC